MNKTIVLFLLVLPFALKAQNGPGGVGSTNGQSSLQLWLMADSGTGTTTNGAYVTLWKDLSGANNHLNGLGSSGTAPEFRSNAINGLPGILFKGSQYFISDSFADSSFANNQATFFVIHQGRDSGTVLNIGLQTMWNEFLLLNNNVYHHISSGNFVEWPHQCIGGVSKDTTLMTTAVFGSGRTDVQYSVNGVLTNQNYWESVSGVPDYSVAKRYIGMGRRDLIGSAISESYTGTVMEVIAYNQKLNAAQIDSVETYIKNKYGIGSSACTLLETEVVDPKNHTISLFPNPNSGSFRIQLPQATDWEINMYNAHGQLIKNLWLKQGDFMEIENVPTGLYFISAKSSDGLISAIPTRVMVH